MICKHRMLHAIVGWSPIDWCLFVCPRLDLLSASPDGLWSIDIFLICPSLVLLSASWDGHRFLKPFLVLLLTTELWFHAGALFHFKKYYADYLRNELFLYVLISNITNYMWAFHTFHSSGSWKPSCVTEGLDFRSIIAQCFLLATSFLLIWCVLVWCNSFLSALLTFALIFCAWFSVCRWI